jgi:hypothetical protein
MILLPNIPLTAALDALALVRRMPTDMFHLLTVQRTGGDDLTTFIVPKVKKIRSLNLPDPQGPAQACSGKTLPFYYIVT